VSRPLIDNKKREAEAAKWHRDVFKAHGRSCFFCGKDATDAMHVIPRAQLGPLRYEIPVQNGRPGCRSCHQLQERGELQFPVRELRVAIAAHNKICKVKLTPP
jgi:hypothetical protein